MNCPECRRLEQERDRLEERYDLAYSSLFARGRPVDLPVYDTLRRAVKEARQGANQAREKWELHRSSHPCQVLEFRRAAGAGTR